MRQIAPSRRGNFVDQIFDLYNFVDQIFDLYNFVDQIFDLYNFVDQIFDLYNFVDQIKDLYELLQIYGTNCFSNGVWDSGPPVLCGDICASHY
jgi:hypothetical protein